jgi:hypothetical protein
MLRILNTIPNSNICGENAGAINSLMEFYKRIIHTTKNLKTPYNELISKKIKPDWYNSYDHNIIIQNIRDIIINMFKTHSDINLWGFKEILFTNGNIKYLKLFNIEKILNYKAKVDGIIN